MDERAAFEAWRAERYAQTTSWCNELGEYPDEFTQGQWKAWKGALAAQPAASAEPEQYKTDDELGGVLAAIRHYGGQKWMEGRGVADDDLKNVREAWDAVYERVQALARYGKAGDAFWSRNGLRATLAPQPAASAEPSDEEIMSKVQEFASTWAVVDGRFDDGTAMERAEACKEEIRALLSRYGRPAGDAQPVAQAHLYMHDGRRQFVLCELGTKAAAELPLGKHDLYAAPVAAQKADDAELLDWLEQHDGRFYNTDRISSIVGTGFIVARSGGLRHQTIRSAIRAAIAQQRKGEA